MTRLIRKEREEASVTANNLYRKYGASLAQEFAHGRSTGVYIDRYKRGRKFWLEVWNEIQKIYEQDILT